MTNANEQIWRLMMRNRPDLIGGEFEVCDRATITRGPIRSIVIRGGNLVITTDWTAFIDCTPDCTPTGRVWRELKAEAQEFSFDLVQPGYAASVPRDILNRGLLFTAPNALCILRPAGSNKLDRASVRRR